VSTAPAVDGVFLCAYLGVGRLSTLTALTLNGNQFSGPGLQSSMGLSSLVYVERAGLCVACGEDECVMSRRKGDDGYGYAYGTWRRPLLVGHVCVHVVV